MASAFGLDGGCDVLLLGHHNAQIDHLKARLRESVVEDLVAHGVDVSADDADDQHLLALCFFHNVCTSILWKFSRGNCIVLYLYTTLNHNTSQEKVGICKKKIIACKRHDDLFPYYLDYIRFLSRRRSIRSVRYIMEPSST